MSDHDPFAASREGEIRKYVLIPALVLSLGATSAHPAPYERVKGWPARSVADHVRGGVSGVGVGRRNDVHLLHRAGRIWNRETPDDLISHPTVLVLDGKTGRVIRAWGENRFVMPHGLTIDRRGNVWITDVKLHQVFKFSPKGKLLMVVGEARVPGSDRTHFNQPSDVAVLSDGSFYVSDGYGNSRIAKFSAEGRFRFEWGSRGAGPGQFLVPHGIDVGPEGRVYVADRENRRVQAFDARGRFLSEWRPTPLRNPFTVVSLQAGVLVAGHDPEMVGPAGPVRAAEFTADGRS
ncbi:MAG TPA: peptidyl-alpha-hydroxyglycine alpha-amidating lyase family protein [Sphingomicrobium sp.]|nr:peptidyl-alpha-hydroxyglycine alpha-amidating lyase family protein [Sphingomicrobium sp.]